MRLSKALGMIAASATLACGAFAQTLGFNIDLDDPYAPPNLGGGAPSSAFGAAAGQAGYWNALDASGFGPTPLYDLTGQLTNVICTGPNGGSGGGYNFTGNTGDYALLLNDGRDMDPARWRLDGLAAGSYLIYVYAVPSNGSYNPTPATVTSDSGSTTLFVTGPMPGNQFILGVTHQVFSATIAGGPLTIFVDQGQYQSGFVNGFQIVPVPEPTTMLITAAGGLALLLRKRQKKRG